MLTVYAWAVLDQVWAIAADEGEVDGEDVLCPAEALTPTAVLLELPRGRDATVEAVAEALAGLRAAGCIVHEAELVRIHGLSAYNARRYAERQRARANRTRTVRVQSANVRVPLADVAEDRTVQDRTTTTPPTILPSVGASPAAPAQEPAKPKRPRKPATGAHAEFIAWWEERYQATQGTPYVGRGWQAEAPQVARLLKALGPDELRVRAERLLVAAEDDFIAGTDRGIGVLATCINKPILRGQRAVSNGSHGGVQSSLDAIARAARMLDDRDRARGGKP